ncbi:MAG TPA: aminotransferase class III-fold pyridoxal phosphate-dependent enzyme, partial [Dongiaceae bacterium]|nr:aminotransferase class III-fold pyridoxal phosphate-dependent enzyme [Dongiaceae bacterium]
WQTKTGFDTFLEAVSRTGFKAGSIAGVLMETYQGVGPDFAPLDYVRQLADWCREHQVVLIFDEVQAGFGRTGKFWAFEHYGVIPDLICCGKGISSSLPISAVIGREEIMDQFGPGSMTSTHTGNPVCCAAALASMRKINTDGLVAKAAELGPVLLAGLQRIRAAQPDVVGHVAARGLVGGVQLIKAPAKTPDPDLAHAIVERCFHKGLLLFSPVGAWGQTVKIAPPLTIPRAALEEGLAVLKEATEEAIAER